MQFIRTLITLGLGLAPVMAGAYTSTDGHGYKLSCNANGYVLTSKYPTERLIDNGSKLIVKRGIEKIFLGKSCDAYTTAFGDGTWAWEPGGFGVDFADYVILFPQATLTCPAGTVVPRSNCRR